MKEKSIEQFQNVISTRYESQIFSINLEHSTFSVSPFYYIVKMTPSEALQTFISYADDDLDTVRRLYTDLKSRSVNVWFDKENFSPGRWKSQIQKAITKSRFFLFCMSEAALRKTRDSTGFVDDELQWAYSIAMEQDEREFTIIPVRLQDVNRGDHRLSTFQQYDLFRDWDGMVDELAVHLGGRSLNTVVEETIKTEDDKLIEGLFGKALAAFYAGESARSLQFLETAISLNPENVGPWLFKGAALSQLSRDQDALTAVEKALTLNPNAGEAWYVKGRILGRLNRYEDGLNAIENALKLIPGDYSAWYLKGATLGLLNRHEAALTAYERAASFKQDYAEAWAGKGSSLVALGRFEEAVNAFEKLEAIDPKTHSLWIIRKCEALAKLERYEEALHDLEKGLKSNPHNAEILIHRGKTLGNVKRYDEALSSFEKALEINPDDRDAWAGKSRMLFELKRYKDALMAYEITLVMAPEFANGWYWKGRTLKKLGRYNEALNAYEQSLSIYPSDAESWFRKGMTLVDLGRAEEGLEANNEALNLQSDFADAWLNKGSALLMLRSHSFIK